MEFIPFNFPNNSKCSLILKLSNKISCFGQNPIFFLNNSLLKIFNIFLSLYKTSPLSDLRIPTKIDINVDLPDPFSPNKVNISFL